MAARARRSTLLALPEQQQYVDRRYRFKSDAQINELYCIVPVLLSLSRDRARAGRVLRVGGEWLFGDRLQVSDA